MQKHADESEMYAVIGKSIPRPDGYEKVTGEARYLNDIRLSGMLVGKVLRSPHPHARILQVNVEKALAVPGVFAAIAARDTLRKKFGVSSEEALRDKLPLEDMKTRFIGDEVAAVAAVNEEAACAGLARIEVEYQLEPAVFDPLKATEPGAPLIHDDKPNNIAFRLERSFGDVGKGFEEADYVFENRFTTHPQAHTCLETYGVVADVDARGRCTVWIPTQTSHLTRIEISQAMGIPLSRIRVRTVHVGGAFGRSIAMTPLAPIAILLATRAHRPVKILNTREEEFATTRYRHPFDIQLKTGVKADGTLCARQAKLVVDNGAYNCNGPKVMSASASKFSMLYGKCPNIKVEGELVYTNKNYGGAFRGFGNPQVTFAVESQIDMIAERLGMSPKRIRLLNVLTENMTTTCGAQITSCAMTECLEKASDAISPASKKSTATTKEGIGLATMIHSGAGSKGTVVSFNMSEAFIRMNLDGSAVVFVGACETGQGATVALSQIAAEALGLSHDGIRLVMSDTDATPFDLGAFADRTTFMVGNAIKKAADEIRIKLIEVASEVLDLKPADLAASGGEIYAVNDRGRSLAIADLVPVAYEKGVSLVAAGVFVSDNPRPDPKTGYGSFTLAYNFAAHAAKVEVNTRTGVVRVLRYVVVQDVGRVINPLAAEGQLEGSVMQGLGYALSENLLFDNGVIMNPNLFDYKILSALDVPPTQIMLIESVDPNGPFGAKGVGEPAMVPIAPALANAIYDAIGVRITDLPITPQKIVAELVKREREGGRS